jgi:hypothetical protein
MRIPVNLRRCSVIHALRFVRVAQRTERIPVCGTAMYNVLLAPKRGVVTCRRCLRIGA